MKFELGDYVSIVKFESDYFRDKAEKIVEAKVTATGEDSIRVLYFQPRKFWFGKKRIEEWFYLKDRRYGFGKVNFI